MLAAAGHGRCLENEIHMKRKLIDRIQDRLWREIRLRTSMDDPSSPVAGGPLENYPTMLLLN